MNYFWIIFICLVGTQPLYSQENKITPYPMEESALLWEVTGPGVEKGCYLFGTMHLIEKEYFLYPKKLQKIVSKTDQIVMEIAGLPDPVVAMSYLTLKEGSFFDFFNPAQTDSILNWAQTQFSMNEEVFRASFSQLKPVTVVQMATQLHFMGKTESYEKTFQSLAETEGIPLLGLETIEFQLSLFDNLTQEQQVEMVMEGVRSSDEAIESTIEMMQIYQRQEVDSLYMLVENDGGTISEQQAVFLDDRNTDWIPKIEAYIKENQTFIAVGAGHLGGPNGVIRLLEAKGYTLKPIRL